MEATQESTTIIIDTNILMGIPEKFEEIDWGMESGTIYILESVLDELGVLERRSSQQELADFAQSAYDRLMTYTPLALDGGFSLKNGVSLKFARVPDQIPAPLEATNVDHQQIAFAVEKLEENPDRLCVIVTRDQEMAIIANAVHPNLKVISPSPGDLVESIRTRLQHMIEWKGKLEKNGAGKQTNKSVKPQKSAPRPHADPQEVIDKVVRSLYARIRSARHRAILAVAPLELRIALSAHLIPILTRNKRRVVFLFVTDERAVEWWAGELRRRCKLPADSIVSFGNEAITHTGPVRVVIYRHDQIERRLVSHGARFKHAGKNITALVDGCDLLDPVDVAMLLFERDQFIGYSRLPIRHAQAVGSRMLGVFFQQQTVASYTFADAELDNWLYPFDVLRQEVELFADEQEEYSKINEKSLELHGQVTNKYPELKNSNDFWFSLLQVLAHHVDHRAAELFALHERKEEVAQIARAKLEMVAQLVGKAGTGARCIVFDYEQLWTPVLLKHLCGQGRVVEVVQKHANGDEWESKWQKFGEAKVDCLIVQDVPPPGFSQAVIKRLILPSSLTPLPQMAAMTDWVLSHANKGSGVNVDLLYTKGTPEEDAMMAFADTCCGLQFTR